MSMTLHENLARGGDLMTRLRTSRIVICGAGALGGNLCEQLARMGAENLAVIDDDRVEEHNLSTQPYRRDDVGQLKAKMLANGLYRGLGIAVRGHARRLEADNAETLLEGADLVVDAFDNPPSRALVQTTARELGLVCVHAGLSGDGYGEVIWDARYRVPEAVGDDACDYALARNLVMLTVAVTSETVLAYLGDGSQRDRSITLGDLTVSELAL